ncbi:hypothetical protein [Megamonas hypermegale]|uniref:hypothetical protein n=1 Tax=Megamonas hypermegale TaxID=158847 RepID=UPI00195EA753|nr:hypothetical protein [Megamonas hypermegale]MBM6760840.1 hypothetical protein [Megamonas hypermegale]
MFNIKMLQDFGLDSIKELDSQIITLIKYNMLIEGVALVIFAFTSPVIVVTMISTVNPIWYQGSMLIEYGLGGVINVWINKTKLIYLKKYFMYLCVINCILTIMCNFLFAHLPNYRFIALSLINVLISSLVFRTIDDIINNLTTGSSLSILNGKKEGFEQIATLTGTVLIMLLTYFNFDISCDLALTLQCIAYIISCLNSLIITKKLIKHAKINNRW